VWGLEAPPLTLAMISIKGATALAAALATAAVPAAIALAFVLVLPWGVEDIIRADDLVQKITALAVLAAGGQVEVPARLGPVLVVALPHGGTVLALLARLLPAVALWLLLGHTRHAREAVEARAGSLDASVLHADLATEAGTRTVNSRRTLSEPRTAPIVHAQAVRRQCACACGVRARGGAARRAAPVPRRGSGRAGGGPGPGAHTACRNPARPPARTPRQSTYAAPGKHAARRTKHAHRTRTRHAPSTHTAHRTGYYRTRISNEQV
jgi:hypothetical protein